jgi:hypothetical protein
MTTSEINKKFAELAGVEPEYYDIQCPACGTNCNNNSAFCTPPIPCLPDFCADPRLVLEVMMKRKGEDEEFIEFLINQWDGDYAMTENECCLWMVDYILDITGKLALAGIEFMEGRNDLFRLRIADGLLQM